MFLKLWLLMTLKRLSIITLQLGSIISSDLRFGCSCSKASKLIHLSIYISAQEIQNKNIEGPGYLFFLVICSYFRVSREVLGDLNSSLTFNLIHSFEVITSGILKLCHQYYVNQCHVIYIKDLVLTATL